MLVPSRRFVVFDSLSLNDKFEIVCSVRRLAAIG